MRADLRLGKIQRFREVQNLRYNSGSGYGSGYYNGRDYDGYFNNYDRYNRRPYYAYSKKAEDTVVTDNSLAEKDSTKTKN